ncbi:serine/threonine protein phosphatase [Paractinoplanes lichenicola]|uniref:Serine/threonine protein phosphatase n=1 Tax=Paractinoplanes lichenicola TaxID=2802976 RepID=A0ABS1VWN3_9ACTN|nr:serine/threonine protein phosphatase [Actinoplanes lichenicola]MBL7258867.1 serine/threonine protein phosphatase [Actinoplanes lichenicola]
MTTERLRRHAAVAAKLSALSDDRLAELVGEDAKAGIGGSTTTIAVDGGPVFVKRVPLTDLELEHPGSTANLFGLPTFYQYGIGSAGFGVWRELAAHTMTTRWVLGGQYDGFPLLHHWRVLRQAAQGDGELERWIEHWDGNEAVRSRLQAIGAATAAVVLFLEHIPHTVDAWLKNHPAYEMVDDELRRGTEFLRSRGFTHFDAHFHNLLTDGNRLYFADFGLATHTGFAHSADEAAFLARHAGYDRAYTRMHLTTWLISNLLGVPWWESLAHLRAHATELDLPEPAARIVASHTEVALRMDDFARELEHTSKRTPYPEGL